MKYLISGAQLEAALESVTKFIEKSMYIGKPIAEVESSEDLMFYDTNSMMKKLMVTERTLHRYRKDGKIKFTAVGGRIYYPKNYLTVPAENTEPLSKPTTYCRPDCHKIVAPQFRKRTRSKIIDLHRLGKIICKIPNKAKTYCSTDIMRICKLHQVARREKGKDLQLWPKKIKLTYVPIKKPRNPLLGF